jgi:recombination protein RecA
MKIVEKSGAWFSYGDLRIGQGRENSKQFFRDNPDIAAEIERKIRANLGLPTGDVLGTPVASPGTLPPEPKAEPKAPEPKAAAKSATPEKKK